MKSPFRDEDGNNLFNTLASFADREVKRDAAPSDEQRHVPLAQQEDEEDIAAAIASDEDELLLWQEDANGDLINWAEVPTELLSAAERDGRAIVAADLPSHVSTPGAPTENAPAPLTPETPAKAVGGGARPSRRVVASPALVRRVKARKAPEAIYVLEFEPDERVQRGLEKLSGGLTSASAQGRELLAIAGLLQFMPERHLCMIKRVTADAAHERILGCSIVVPVKSKGRVMLSASPFFPHNTCDPVVLSSADRVFRSYLPGMMQLSETVHRDMMAPLGSSCLTIVSHKMRLHEWTSKQSVLERKLKLHGYKMGVAITRWPTLEAAGRALDAFIRAVLHPFLVAPVFAGHALRQVENRGWLVTSTGTIKEQGMPPLGDRTVPWAVAADDAPDVSGVADAWARDIEFAQASNGDKFEGAFTFAMDRGEELEIAPRPIAGRHFGSFAELSG